jgi:hypothetical protein
VTAVLGFCQFEDEVERIDGVEGTANFTDTQNRGLQGNIIPFVKNPRGDSMMLGSITGSDVMLFP